MRILNRFDTEEDICTYHRDDDVDDRLRSFDSRGIQATGQPGASSESNGGRNNSNDVFNQTETENVMNEMGAKEGSIDAPKATLSPPPKEMEDSTEA